MATRQYAEITGKECVTSEIAVRHTTSAAHFKRVSGNFDICK